MSDARKRMEDLLDELRDISSGGTCPMLLKDECEKYGNCDEHIRSVAVRIADELMDAWAPVGEAAEAEAYELRMERSESMEAIRRMQADLDRQRGEIRQLLVDKARYEAAYERLCEACDEPSVTKRAAARRACQLIVGEVDE